MLREIPSPNLKDRDIVSAISTVELSRRPSRRPNLAAENRALVDLARTMANSPDDILQRLSDTALTLCHAQSAGLSLLEDEDDQQNFHWRAISGEWSSHLNGGTPREFGPCGTVLDRNMPLLFSHPERDYPYFSEVRPLLEDALLIPFYIEEKARGTIWVVSHDPDRKFDAEDLRVLTNLGNFAGLAYQTVLSLKASRKAAQIEAQSFGAMQRFTAIIESSDDAILSKNLNGIINSWNPGAERLFGYTAQEAIGRPITMLLPPDRIGEEPDILARIRRGERIDHFATQRVRKDGSLVDISLTISPIRDVTGRVIGASKIARDITAQRHTQELHDLLVAEMKHRIKNTLATVQAIAKQSLGGISAEELNGFVARLHSLSKAHDVLTKENWDRASLLDLVNCTLEPFRTKRYDRFSIRGPQVWLEATKSTLVTMVLHELATNACKYGALSGNKGRVSITWEFHTENPLSVTLVWLESGGPTVVSPKRRGFGSLLIEAALRSELGDPELEFLPDGVVCKLMLRCKDGIANTDG